MTTNKRFKDNLLKLMGVYSLTQQQLADDLEIDIRTIGYWLGKRSSIPVVTTLIKIASRFDTTIEALLN